MLAQIRRWTVLRCHAWVLTSIVLLGLSGVRAWAQDATPIPIPATAHVGLAELIIDSTRNTILALWVMWTMGKWQAELTGWRELLSRALDGAKSGQIRVSFDVGGHETLTSALKALSRTIRDTADGDGPDIDEQPEGPTPAAAPRRRRSSVPPSNVS